MKKVFILGMIVLSFIAVSAHAGINDGLVAYYPFNGNVNDESGHENHGTVIGANPTTDRFGNADSAYSFDGEDDYLDTHWGSGDIDNDDPSTISLWIKSTVKTYDMTDGQIAQIYG